MRVVGRKNCAMLVRGFVGFHSISDRSSMCLANPSTSLRLHLRFVLVLFLCQAPSSGPSACRDPTGMPRGSAPALVRGESPDSGEAVRAGAGRSGGVAVAGVLPMPSHAPTARGAAVGDGEGARRPVSRVLSRTRPGGGGRRSDPWMTIPLGRPSPDASRDQPGRRRGHVVWDRSPGPVPPLFGLAPGGVCHAVPVAGDAVRSYRTLSPLPVPRDGRSALCGTFPGVAPAGRYPAPCLRGARTFLDACAPRSSGRLAASV